MYSLGSFFQQIRQDFLLFFWLLSIRGPDFDPVKNEPIRPSQPQKLVRQKDQTVN
jgi:hypothetical protein